MGVATERHRAFYPVVLRAHVALLDEGQPPTFVNLAKKLHRSRQAVHAMFLRHPDLGPWIDRQVSAHTDMYTGSVVHRVAHLAMRGSAQHAEIYFRYRAGGYAPRVGFGMLAADDPSMPGGVLPGASYTLNLLIPRPPTPELPPHDPGVMAPRASDIPVVATT